LIGNAVNWIAYTTGQKGGMPVLREIGLLSDGHERTGFPFLTREHPVRSQQERFGRDNAGQATRLGDQSVSGETILIVAVTVG